MPEGILTIDDLLKNKSRLAGGAQESLVANKVKSEKLSAQGGSARGGKVKNPKSNIAPINFRNIPTSAEQPENIPDTKYWLPNTGYQIPDTNEQQEAEQSLREQVLAAKQDEAKKKEKEEEKSVAGEETTGTKKWSARALALAFWFLPTIIFFVPAILYIDIHILLRWIFGEKLFCKLGDEGGITKIANITGKLAEGATKEYRRIIDIIVVLFSNTVLFSAVFAFFGIIAVMVNVGGGWTASGITGMASLGAYGAGYAALLTPWTAWMSPYLFGVASWLGYTSLGAGIMEGATGK